MSYIALHLKGVDYKEKEGDFENIQVATDRGLQVFTFKKLQSATGGFGKSNVIGHGAFGLVYQWVLKDGRKVAVKLMNQAGKHGEEEFEVEVLSLSTFPSLSLYFLEVCIWVHTRFSVFTLLIFFLLIVDSLLKIIGGFFGSFAAAIFVLDYWLLFRKQP